MTSLKSTSVCKGDWASGDRTIEYTYDDNGSLIEKKTWDTTPEPDTLLETVTYDYNLENRLERVTIDDGDNIDEVTEYKYNPAGIRVSADYREYVDTVENTSAAKTTSFLIDAYNHTGYAQVFEQNTTDISGTTTTFYFIGSDVIGQATGNAQNAPKYLLYDGHGSTRQLADSTGSLITNESYSYDAYGVILGGERATQTSLLYTGEQFDTDLQMYYNRARYYDQNNGRFNRVDPFSGSPSHKIV